MKDFMKKKMYLILLVVSFSTLFSAILYADPIYCENDSQCPQGMVCVIPGNYCIEPAVITCDYEASFVELSKCYIQTIIEYDDYTLYDCFFDGIESHLCMLKIVLK